MTHWNPPAPRPPDYSVSAMDKKTQVRGIVGAAWVNEDGRINVKFNAFTTLDIANPNVTLTLFPKGYVPKDKRKKKPDVSEAPSPSEDVTSE